MSDPQGVRGRRGLAHTLITPGNQYVSRLPSLPGARFVKLVTPRLQPARFAQYLIDAAPEGTTCRLDTTFEHFLFGLAGSGSVGLAGSGSVGLAGSGSVGLAGSGSVEAFALADEGYAYIPEGAGAQLSLEAGARVLWITRRYEPWPGLEAPAAVGGHARSLAPAATVVDGLWRRELLDPLDPAFDFNMSLMTFDPGVGLHQIEIHDEEHGLYMTAGGGTYQLEQDRYEVSAADFIYMAPYCPQWFRADARGGEYLLYKDVYRTGF